MNSESDDTYDSKRGKWRSADVKTEENVDFSTLLLPERIQLGLKNCGFEKPSPVQLQAIPLGRCGIDLVVQAKSGTGKTCVMAVIALDGLVEDLPDTQVLILAPTREIASQICDVIRDLGCAFPDLSCDTFIGGLPLRQDKAKLPLCQIVVGTPGRIKQLIDMEILQTDSVRLFVVDEADRLFDKQFKEDINWIFSSLPARKQILALSATYPDELSKFLSLYMESPVFVRINSKDPALLAIAQCFRSTPYHPMLQVSDSAKFDVLLDILNSVTFSQCMIFCQRQTKAQDLADNLVLKGFPSLSICSALDQARRLEIIHELKSFQCRVLVSTDLTARGIDAENVDLVINFEIPYEAETYLHRIGRAGRYGTRGMAISLASDGDEMKRLKTFQKKFLLKIYQLPDPIPVNLWDQFMTLQTLEHVEREQNETFSNCSGSDKTNGLHDSANLENSSHAVKLNQTLSQSNATDQLRSQSNATDQLRKNVADNADCSNNAVECSDNGILNGNILSDNLEKTEVVNDTESSLISNENKTENICASEVGNSDNSNTTNQVECQLQVKSHEDVQPAELEINGNVEETTSVEMLVQKGDDKDNMMCVPGVISIVSSCYEVITNLAEDENNSASTVKLDLCSSNDLSQSKGEDMDSSRTEVQMERTLTEDNDELFKTDNPKSMDLKESDYKSEVTSAQGEQTMQPKVVSCPLFQKLEKYFHPDEGNTNFSDEDVSDILEPLLGVGKTGDSKSFLSYDELVHSWKSCSVIDPVKNYPNMSVPHIPNIPQAQVEVLEKYIYNDKCKFFSDVQKIFETEYDPISCERKVSSESLADTSTHDKNVSAVPASDVPYDDDQHASRSDNISQNETVTSSETIDLKQEGDASSVVVTAESQDSCEINSSEWKSDVIGEHVHTLKEPSAILPDRAAVGTPVGIDIALKNRFLPFHTNKSLEQIQGKSSDNKHDVSNTSRLTDAVHDSVTCGIKHSKIVALPPVPGDLPENSRPVNKLDSGHVSIPNEKPFVKNQGVKKKVRGASKKVKKHKKKTQENSVNFSNVCGLEWSVSSKSDVMEENYSSFPPSQERETEKCSNVTFDNAPVLQIGSEKRHGVDHRKKRTKVSTERRQKNEHGSPRYCETETMTGYAYQNRTNAIDSGMGDYCSPCVAFAPHYVCCCRLPRFQQSGTYFQSPVPFANGYPQYYYKKFLEQWYYIQQLAYSYYHH